jgi:pyruvate dehydrogenase E2 component (dihydrolipoamide acetyltransferase)
MAELLPVPEVAAGATAVTLADWLVKPGQEFKAGDPIAVIETDKAVVEIEAERAATLLRPLVEEGATVEVGAPMALLGTAAELAADLDALLRELGVGGDAGAAAGGAVVDAEPAAPAAASATSVASAAPAVVPVEPEPAPETGRRIFISPLARKLLAAAGIAPQDVRGTGPHGRIRRVDVEAAVRARDEAATAPVEAPAPPEPVTPASPVVPVESDAWTEVPHSRLRKAVARRLTASKQEIPHFYLKRTARIDALLALRSQLNELAPVKLSVNDFVLRAVAVAHARVPEANVTWGEEAMRHHRGADVGVAIASEKGLVTPVLRGLEHCTLGSIATQVRGFVEQANTGRLQQRDLEGGSITVTNLGMYGVEEFAAIINPPQAAILAVGAGRQTPVVSDGELTVATTMDLVLSVDHRAIDGALAAQWSAVLVEVLEQPLGLLV